MTLLDEILAHARHKQTLSFIAEREKLTFFDLTTRAQLLAKNFAQLNCKKGDRVLICLSNSPDFAVALLASWLEGCVVVPINPLYKNRELAALYRDCQPKVVVALDALASFFQSQGEAPVITQNTKPLSLASMYRERLPKLSPTSLSPQDLACILYTSGTTSDPKGVMLTHGNLSANVHAALKELPVQNDDTLLTALPLYHSFGLTCCLLLGLTAGCKNIFLDRFTPQRVFELVKKHSVTYLPGVPTMFDYLLNHPGKKQQDLASLRYCFSGGAPLSLETLKGFEAEFGVDILEGYGLTETSPVITLSGGSTLRKLGSVGKPLSCVKVRVLREDASPCAVGEVGEIVVSGDSVMAGYFNQPEETAKVFRDGWFYTGDLGKLDADNYLYIVGRKKEMVIVGGFNVYPKEVENVLRQHPKVAEAFVQGRQGPGKGESVCAYVVPKPRSRLSYEEILEYARENLAAYKIPRHLAIVKKIPRTDTGKVDRKSLLRGNPPPSRLP